jgi:hypothetical protein
MAIRSTILFDDRNDVQRVVMGFEWDDTTNLVTEFVFRIDAGARGVIFTLIRLSDGASRSHDFTPDTTRRWTPPFNLPVVPVVNQKTGATIGLPNGWAVTMVFD